MSSGHSLSQSIPDDLPVLRRQCGCEVVLLAPGITADHKRCPEAESLNDHQASLARRLMAVPEGSEAERHLIDRIEAISNGITRHRSGARIQRSEYPAQQNETQTQTRERNV